MSLNTVSQLLNVTPKVHLSYDTNINLRYFLCTCTQDSVYINGYIRQTRRDQLLPSQSKDT